MKKQSFLNLRSVTSGFTLLEVLVTVVLIGVLFAIAAPNWVAFINQQRVGSARNQVSQAIRNAQSEAQRTKISRAVVFDNNNDQPRYAIVSMPNDNRSTVNRSSIQNWQSLGDGSIQPGTISLSVNRRTSSNEPSLLIFDSYGSVVSSTPYRITIGATVGVNPRRCVTVETLLGALSEDSDSNCPTS